MPTYSHTQAKSNKKSSCDSTAPSPQDIRGETHEAKICLWLVSESWYQLGAKAFFQVSSMHIRLHTYHHNHTDAQATTLGKSRNCVASIYRPVETFQQMGVINRCLFIK